jgi:hypothetical protein
VNGSGVLGGGSHVSSARTPAEGMVSGE